MRDFLNLDHVYNSDIQGASSSSSLPLQTVPISKKGDTFKKEVMNRLEQIGIAQMAKNLSFRNYRKMYEGRLVYQDFDEAMTVTNDIMEFREKSDIPSFIKHYDILGTIINQLSGEFNTQKDKITVDSIDQFSQGEYFREKNAMISNYVREYFDLEFQRLMLMSGVEMQEEFESEEEQQQYLQYIEGEKAKLISPDRMEENLSKTFQTTIGEWAGHRLKADTIKFDMDSLDLEELVDYLLTGRYFRHYHIGYDYYRPETWRPETTFFSQDLNILYPQKGEYVGQILFLSGADTLQRYGHLLNEKQQEMLYGYDIKGTSSGDTYSLEGTLRRGLGEMQLIPDASYYQRDLAYRMQDIFEQPMGKQYKLNEDGEQEARPAWLDNSHRYGSIGNRYAKYLRDDIDVRDDILQITEAYFRGAKRVGLLTIQNELMEEPQQIEVEETLLKEFIKENKIKQLRTVSLKEAKENKEIDTIAWFYVPQVWKGKKINAGNTKLQKDIFFDIEPLEFQIRGDSNLFDVELPVAGIVTSSVADKIKPYQIDYNIAMNQIRSLLEKELGMGFMMDYNFLPSQYKNEMGETTRELIEEWRENIRELGFSFYDSSMQNTGGQNPNASVIQPIDISYIPQIKNKMELAEFWRQKALEQIGITPQRAGTPNKYETVEGIRSGQEASYAQTERIYRMFNTAKRKERELHLYVAQYAVKDNKDITVDYLSPDHGRIIKKFTDDKFWLRKINVIPINDSNQRKNLESFKSFMLQNNTMNADFLDYARLFTSDSFVTLVNYAEESRKRHEKETQASREHENSMLQKQIELTEKQDMDNKQHESDENQKDRVNVLRKAKIDAAAKIADNNFDMKYLKEIERMASDELVKEENETKTKLQERELTRKETKDDEDLKIALQKLKNETEKIKAQNRKSQNDLLIAKINNTR